MKDISFCFAVFDFGGCRDVPTQRTSHSTENKFGSVYDIENSSRTRRTLNC